MGGLYANLRGPGYAAAGAPSVAGPVELAVRQQQMQMARIRELQMSVQRRARVGMQSTNHQPHGEMVWLGGSPGLPLPQPLGPPASSASASPPLVLAVAAGSLPEKGQAGVVDL